jgi:hypothetical protein
MEGQWTLCGYAVGNGPILPDLTCPFELKSRGTVEHRLRGVAQPFHRGGEGDRLEGGSSRI